MSKRKTTNTRKKNAKLSKGQELNVLETSIKTKTTTKKGKKTNVQNKQKNAQKTIQKEIQEVTTAPIPAKEKEQIKNVEEKTKVQAKRKPTKKQIRFKAEKKPFFNKTSITIIIIICIVCGIIAFKYSYDNYFHKGNYVFKTNLTNVRANMTSTTKNIEPINEGVNESVIYISLDYDQIVLSNGKVKEYLSNDKPFFKYYGDDYAPLSLNEKYEIDYMYFTPFDKQNITFTTDNKCVDISDNVITAKTDGEATIYACYGNTKNKILQITSTSLINIRDKEFNNTKPFLSCEQYTDEENEIIDKILEYKINKAGYHTRAGAVEALRFLTLDFPYRVNYFNENGRLPTVDAQGRYYHKGLYLSTGKYNDLLDPDDKNKGTWGCKIYSNPIEGKMQNGLDCSGLICWALFNAGYDPKDVKGANLLMTLGDIHNPKEAIESKKVKVGDLVHNDEADSHIGMIVGIDEDNNYYVAQAIWYNPKGVIITKYTKKQMISHWLQIILLDDYYKVDGDLTNMWY